MAGDGFFLGGMAEGISDAQKQALAERAQTEKTGIAGRELDIKNQLAQHTMSQDMIARADALIANTMAPVAEFIKQGLAVGADPTMLRTKAQAAIDTVKPIAIKFGRNPAALDQQVEVLLAGPTGVQAAAGAGAAKGTEQAATQITGAKLLGAPGAPGVSIILDPKQRADMEKTLSDDYRAESKTFVQVRDFYDRTKSASKDAAGDIALVFSFMKMLDPGGKVTDQDYATASNAGGVPDTVRKIWNNMLDEFKQGGDPSRSLLGPDARKMIQNQSDIAWKDSTTRYNQLTQQFSEKATRYGINPKNVIIDYNPQAATKPDPLGIR